MDDFDRSNDYTRGEEAEGKSDRGQNRTRDQKGLRDRISPYCTLSQNGYGAAVVDWREGGGGVGVRGPRGGGTLDSTKLKNYYFRIWCCYCSWLRRAPWGGRFDTTAAAGEAERGDPCGRLINKKKL